MDQIIPSAPAPRSRGRLLAACVTLLALVGVTLAGATMTSAGAVTPLEVRPGDKGAVTEDVGAVHTGRAARMRYGAIALNIRDGAYGFGNEYSTKRAALNRAQRGCKSRSNHPRYCRKITWVRNGCASVAARFRANGTVARYGYSTAFRTKRAAARKARQKCGSGCRTRVTICTTRYY